MMSDKVYRVEEVESGYDLGRGRRGRAYTIYNARTGWSLYGPYHRRDALERKLAFLREHGWCDEKESAQGE